MRYLVFLIVLLFSTAASADTAINTGGTSLPAGATDNALVCADGTSGDIQQCSGGTLVWDDDAKGTITSTLDDATGDEAAMTLNYTTNKASSGDDIGLKIDWTDTASPGTSYPLWIGSGATRHLSIDSAGDVVARGDVCVSGGTTYCLKSSASLSIVDGTNGVWLRYTSDSASGDVFSMQPQPAGTELTDTDGRQAFFSLKPEINQSGTAAYDGIYLDVTETALGDGSTGDGNNLLNLAVGGSSGWKVTNKGHVVVDDGIGSAPTLSSCGTSPTLAAGSTDHAGIVTLGSGSPTDCTLTFGNAYTNTPSCIAIADANATVYISAHSASALTVSGPATFTAFNYICVGLNGGS